MVYSSTLLLLCCVLIEALSLLLLVVTSTTVQTKIVLRAHDFGSRVIVVAHHRDLRLANLLADRQVQLEVSPAHCSADPRVLMATPHWSEASAVKTQPDGRKHPSIRPSILARCPAVHRQTLMHIRYKLTLCQ